MRRSEWIRRLVIVLSLAACTSGVTSAGERSESKRWLSPRGDREYAQELHRRLLGRDATGAELESTLRGFTEREHRIRAQTEILDSAEFGGRVEDLTFLHGLFVQLRGRKPLLHEMQMGLHFLGEGVPRSEIFGSLLHGETPVRHVTPELVKLYDDFLLDFRPRRVRRWERQAQAPGDLSREELRRAIEVEAERLGGVIPGPAAPSEPAAPETTDLQIYFGYLHAHTSVSFDAQLAGSGGPFEAFDQARNVAGLDFMGLSDHAEFISVWPWKHEWDLLRAAADAFNEDNEFVALRGFEYSNPIYGHINVFGTEGFTSTWFAPTLPLFYLWLSLRPDAAGTFNHPGLLDVLGLDLLHFNYYPAVAQQLVAVEILTHVVETGAPDPYERYSVGYVPSDGLGHLDEAIQAGWRVAGISAQDNHLGTWGLLDDYRTGVLASRLTREGILEAIRRRRFYTTQDKNLLMFFRADGREMGSILPGGDKELSVELDDEDGEGFSTIELFANGQPVETRDVSGTGTWLFLAPASVEPVYYYVTATQEDGDRAMSAPIWILGEAR